MSSKMSDVTLHVDENTSHGERENLRNALLSTSGIMAAAYHDEKPHLFVIEYDPDKINSSELIDVAKSCGLNSELVGL